MREARPDAQPRQGVSHADDAHAGLASGEGTLRSRFGEYVRTGTPFGVLAVGVDNFDRINNLYSYAFGDLVLDKLAELVTDLLPEDAETLQFDGDCYGAIIPSVVDADALRALFARVLAETTAGFTIEGAVVAFKVSGGICVYPDNGLTPDELYRNLHIALIDAKRRGRGRCTVCTPELCEASHKTLLLMETLQACIAHGFEGFSARYQPIVDAQTEELHGCEVLMRWSDELFPEGVTPFEFIPYLEESGLIGMATSWLMDEAFEKAARWTAKDPSFVMNINLSKYVLDDPSFKFRIVEAAKSHRVEPRNIMLELTESGMITDAADLGGTFDFLRSQGFGVAFDDFGTGYASLNLFRVIAADELKVDRSFLERITYDVNDQRIVSSIIDLCHRMNLSVCVEGVETDEVLGVVRALGADYIQGYLYDQPLDAAAFEEKHLDGRKQGKAASDVASLVYARAQPVQPLSPSELIDRAHAGVFQVAMDENFTFITCNEGYRRMLGYTAPEIATKLGNRALAIVHPDDMASVNEEIRRQLGQGDTVLIEFRIVRADGSFLWITGTGNVVRPKIGTPYLVVVIMDTDRFKRKSLRVAKELAMTKGILDDAPAAIKCLADDDRFTVKYLSPEFLAVIGYTREEVRDRFDNSYLNLMHPDDIPTALAAVKKAAKPGREFGLCYRLRASDGRLLWIETKTKLSEPDENGECYFVSVVTTVEGPNAQSGGLLLENRYQTASKSWGDVLFNLYVDTGIVEFTDNYENELGAPPCRTLAEQLALSPEADRAVIENSIEQAKRGEVPSPIEMRIAPKGNEEYLWCSLSVNCAETSEGEPTTVFGRIKNIDAEKRERDELVHESRTDLLCNVYNKITVESMAQTTLDHAGPDDHFAFSIIDIDNFKDINDRAGHLVGDRMLVSVAGALQEQDADKLVGRIGGDEFVTVEPCGASSADVLAHGEDVIERIARLCREEDPSVDLHTSMGIARFPEDGRSFYDLYKHADAALYLAKERGKNQVCLYRE